jgi:hypothetical protein
VRPDFGDTVATVDYYTGRLVMSTDSKWYSALLSRKFLLSVMTLLSNHYLVANQFIADGVYSAVMIATVGAYIAGNVVQKATAKAT